MSQSQRDLSRRHLLAGSVGPERRAARPDPDEPRWYEPLHVRDRVAARERIASQVESGASIVVAPAWRSHRRALLDVGETRRAATWTASAVRVTREGVETGLERRAMAREAAPTAVVEGPVMASGASDVLVAGPLPPLDDAPEPGTGRLATTEVASERDHRELCGHLADAAVDLLLVTPRASFAASRVAVAAAVDTGLPAWAGVSLATAQPGSAEQHLPDGTPLETWLELVRHLGAAGVLIGERLHALEPETSRVEAIAARLRDGDLPWGIIATPPGGSDGGGLVPWAEAWLRAGASVLGLEDGATSDRIEHLRTVFDRLESAENLDRVAEQVRWQAFVAEAARGAAGGHALWVGSPSPSVTPPGFDWILPAADEVPRMPRGHYRLVVVDGGTAIDGPGLAALLHEGGLLVVRGEPPAAAGSAGLRVVTIADDARPHLTLLRRDPD